MGAGVSQGTLPLEMELPFDGDDPVLRAVAWSSIIEPGDPAAGQLVRLLGPKDALRWVFNPICDPHVVECLAGSTDPEVPWQKCHQRWHPRAMEMGMEESLHALTRLGGTILTRESPQWPTSLAVLEDRQPLALWVVGHGDIGQLQMDSVALVGARASTGYGNRIAQTFASDLTSAGFPVVSGGAYGIDTAAHQGAISAQDGEHVPGSGIAVLCGGLGNPYPSGNAQLFSRLIENGILISEVPPHWRPARWRFLERNRIIAALSAATVIVEAGIRSGAMATANRAAEMGRPVGAVPGPVTSTSSAGCHQLIREGAELIVQSTDVQDLLAGAPVGTELQFDEGPSAHLSAVAKVVWSAFPLSRCASVKKLALSCGLGLQEVELALLEMQLKGQAELVDGEWHRRAIG